jgi:hypothetical protein
MKWYKKQLKEILDSQDRDKKTKKDDKVKNPPRHSFSAKPALKGKNNFVSPVAARNRNRSKTDLP